MTRRAAALCAFAITSYALPAGAQARCDAADREIQGALDLRRQSRDADALRALQDLWQRCPTPRLRAQIALAEEALRLWPDAWDHLHEALLATTDPWITSRRPALEQVRDRIRPHLAALAPNTDVPGAELYIAGRRIGALPLAEPHVVPACEIQFELRAEGRTARRTVTLGEGDIWRETVSFDEPPPSPPPPPPPPPPPLPPPVTERVRRVEVIATPPIDAPPSPTRRYVGYALIGVGAAASAFGVVQWVLSSTQQSEADADPAWRRFYHSNRSSTVDQACALAESATGSDAARARDMCGVNASHRVMAWAFGVGGLVLAGAGVALAVTAPSRSARALRLHPAIGAAFAGATLEASF